MDKAWKNLQEKLEGCIQLLCYMVELHYLHILLYVAVEKPVERLCHSVMQQKMKRICSGQLVLSDDHKVSLRLSYSFSGLAGDDMHTWKHPEKRGWVTEACMQLCSKQIIMVVGHMRQKRSNLYNMFQPLL